MQDLDGGISVHQMCLAQTITTDRGDLKTKASLRIKSRTSKTDFEHLKLFGQDIHWAPYHRLGPTIGNEVPALIM